eukprot:TRINITY_DN1209_c0_g1_i1.p2 TRINITY_DN1209_c0_g1~~TRINITY_DN1209_c0_g1_i1.p2  ORF type:complete len:143 (+),score=36.47 TRINITY_DN1209_c0_g1_i1:864-1292(+)
MTMTGFESEASNGTGASLQDSQSPSQTPPSPPNSIENCSGPSSDVPIRDENNDTERENLQRPNSSQRRSNGAGSGSNRIERLPTKSSTLRNNTVSARSPNVGEGPSIEDHAVPHAANSSSSVNRTLEDKKSSVRGTKRYHPY